MKAYLVLVLVVGLTHAKPGKLPEDAERVPGAATRDPEFYYGGATPFDFLRSFNDIFEQMRRQMAVLLTQGKGGAPGVAPGDLGDGNSTSVTRVIGGHKYTVNETVYSGGDGETAIFKVRVVDIRPQDSAEEGPKTVNPKDKEVDSLENDVNRPFQKREIELEDEMETLNLDNDIEYGDREPMRVVPGHYIGDDLRVNDILHARGRPMNPDAELLDFEDVSEPKERTLKDDLRVNDIARRMGWKMNPDAEMIEEGETMKTGDEVDSTERNEMGNEVKEGLEMMEDGFKPMVSQRSEAFMPDIIDVQAELIPEFTDIETLGSGEDLDTSPSTFDVAAVPIGHYMGNDIHVNHLAAARGWSVNPDAELIDFDESPKHWNNQIDFGYNHVESESSRSRYYYNAAAADR